MNTNLQKIIGMVWAETSVSLAEMQDTSNRHKTIVAARCMVVGLARDTTFCSFPEIQAAFDDAKGHSSQIGRDQSHRRRLEIDSDYAAIYWRIRRRIESAKDAA